MKDLAVHALLFFVVSVVIVLMGSFHADSDDRRALRTFPRRLGVFLLGCAALAAVMLVLEALFT